VEVRLTHIGGPTLLVEVGGWRLLTDPTFDPPGRKWTFGPGAASRKLGGPALPAEELGDIDAVLLSHDQHGDNLDEAGRAFLPSAGTVITTTPGAKRLAEPMAGATTGLEPWATTTLHSEGKPAITITATPCRHGPPLSRPLVGAVIGFALEWEGQDHGALWITGDTVLYDGVRQVAGRLDVGTALIHLGGVRFWSTGPARYTMTAKDAVELCHLVRPRLAIPIHYEGWSHFQEERDGIATTLEQVSPPTEIRWIPIGAAASVDV
jgi:L-ascorbate metabolism protein UlaG (beta-lactamase superfamily)